MKLKIIKKDGQTFINGIATLPSAQDIVNSTNKPIKSPRSLRNAKLGGLI